MISCTEFIPAYSEGFKFIESIGGRNEVERFWAELSALYLKDSLENLVAKDGLNGCYTYWSHSLNEEAADFTMILDDENDEFTIQMHQCPSKKLLLEQEHMFPYDAYCDHCEALYRPIVEKYGYDYEGKIDCVKPSCIVKINKSKKL
jgi:hypothetical protein